MFNSVRPRRPLRVLIHKIVMARDHSVIPKGDADAFGAPVCVSAPPAQPNPNGDPFPSKLTTQPTGGDSIFGPSKDTGNIQIISNFATGICHTTAVGPDKQGVAPGNGKPDTVCIQPGQGQKKLHSTPGGDDHIVNNQILSGPNGICESDLAFDKNTISQHAPSSTDLMAEFNRIWDLQGNMFLQAVDVVENEAIEYSPKYDG